MAEVIELTSTSGLQFKIEVPCNKFKRNTISVLDRSSNRYIPIDYINSNDTSFIKEHTIEGGSFLSIIASNGTCVFTPDSVSFFNHNEVSYDHGAYNGKGVLKLHTGVTYTGEFKNSKPHGFGSVTDANGIQYIGEFKDGIAVGNREVIEPNGAKYTYVGTCKDGLPHGIGIIYFIDGTSKKIQYKLGKKALYTGEPVLNPSQLKLLKETLQKWSSIDKSVSSCDAFLLASNIRKKKLRRKRGSLVQQEIKLRKERGRRKWVNGHK